MIYCSKNYNDLINQTAQLVLANKNKPTIVFCEDKIALEIEMAITSLIGGSIFCEVTTLNRFMKRSTSLSDVCTKQTISLIIKKLLNKNNDNLKTFKNLNSYSLAGAIAELIAQLKSAKVTPQDLMASAQKFNGVFNYKICDIALIYKEYEDYLEQNKLLDTNNKFSLFVDKINEFHLENYNVIVAGFQSVTAQIATFFKELNTRAKSLDFLVLQGQENLYVNEVYYFAKGLGQELATCVLDNHIRYFILENLFAPTKKTMPYVDNVRVFSYQTDEDEIIDVAKQIKHAVINGASWGDFMLVCSELEKSKNFVKKIFSDYDIPYFLEDYFNLSTHPLLKAICDYIDLSYSRFNINNYKKVLRHTTLFSNTEFIDNFIEYITINSHSAKSLIDDGIQGESEESILYEEFRVKTFNLPKFYAEETAEKYANKVLTLLKDTCALENLNLLAERLKEENLLEQAEFIVKGYDYILNILEETIKVLSQEKITIKEFKALLLSSATYTELSVIPQKGDRVYLGDLNSCKFRFSKHLFVTGLNSNIPNAMSDTAILTNSDLKRLDKISVIIEPKLDIVNARNKENIGVCLSNFSDSLTLSYALSSGGKECLPSEILQEICNCFTVLGTKENPEPLDIIPKSLVYDYILKNGTDEQKLKLEGLKYLSKQTALKNFAVEISNFKYLGSVNDTFSSLYNVAPDPVFKELLDEIINSTNSTLTYTIKGSGELFFKDNKVSASGIEKYYECPYKNFLINGLGISEEDKGEITAFGLGTFLHAIYENFEKRILQGEIIEENDIERVANELIDQLLDQEEYKKYTKKAVYENLFKLLKQEVKDVLLTLILNSKKSSFKPTYFEYSFGFNNKQRGIPIKTQKGDYEVRGKIDRVDIAGDYVRIIDYKTGTTTNFEDVAKLFNGSKLQLYLYLNIFLQKELTPAGVYYAPMNSEFLKQNEQKGKSLKGKTVNTEDILQKTDCDYKNGSTIIDADLTKKGELKLSNVLTSQTLISLCKYARLITAKAIEQIKEDCAVISPNSNGCKYCNFSGLCGFTKEKFNTTREDISITEEQIAQIVEDENE